MAEARLAGADRSALHRGLLDLVRFARGGADVTGVDLAASAIDLARALDAITGRGSRFMKPLSLFVLMLLRVPVGMAMGLVGVTGFGYLVGFSPALKLVGQTSMRTVTDYTFGVIPMFLLMGTFVSNSGMSRELFRAANGFVGHLRGGLGIATVGACGMTNSAMPVPSRTYTTKAAGQFGAMPPSERRTIGASWSR